MGDMIRRRHNASALRREAADAVAGRSSRRRVGSGSDGEDGEDEEASGSDGGALVKGSASGRRHRSNCMCIICKQARGSGGTWGGMDQAAGGPGGGQTATAVPGGTYSSRAGPVLRIQYSANGQPQLRFGKRAYVYALPTLPMGFIQHRSALPRTAVRTA